MRTFPTLVAALSFAAVGCSSTALVAEAKAEPQAKKPPVPANASTLVVGGGCFWCIEAIFEDLQGVYDVESGYAGGDLPKPTYDDVLTGQSGHAEVIKIRFDPKAISADDLLRLFFVAHDPTTLNRQGPDVGPQYRSAIFYANPQEKARAERIKAEIEKEKLYPRPIVTTIEPLKNYGRAEEYHQDYFAKFERASPAERAKMNAGYCAYIIEPKVKKFREKYAAKLRRSE